MNLKLFVLLASLCYTLTIHAQTEPQFKFYLAFEDAKNERDTVWFIVDTTATTGFNDTVFGEGKVPLDSTVFQVWFGYENDSAWKTFANPLGGGGGMPGMPKVYASNVDVPIIIHWDTNLLKNHNLPFELKQAWIDNDFIYISGYNYGYDLFRNAQDPGKDSFLLDSFTVGGGPGEHFPLKVFFSKDPKTVGIETATLNEGNIRIFPVPATDVLHVDAEGAAAEGAVVYSLDGKPLLQHRFNGRQTSGIDVSSLPPGIYMLQIQTTNAIHYEKIIKY